jgi:hypothetical protein
MGRPSRAPSRIEWPGPPLRKATSRAPRIAQPRSMASRTLRQLPKQALRKPQPKGRSHSLPRPRLAHSLPRSVTRPAAPGPCRLPPRPRTPLGPPHRPLQAQLRATPHPHRPNKQQILTRPLPSSHPYSPQGLPSSPRPPHRRPHLWPGLQPRPLPRCQPRPLPRLQPRVRPPRRLRLRSPLRQQLRLRAVPWHQATRHRRPLKQHHLPATARQLLRTTLKQTDSPAFV